MTLSLEEWARANNYSEYTLAKHRDALAILWQSDTGEREASDSAQAPVPALPDEPEQTPEGPESVRAPEPESSSRPPEPIERQKRRQRRPTTPARRREARWRPTANETKASASLDYAERRDNSLPATHKRMGPWIRLYEETLDDPKIHAIDDGDFRGWANSLLVAGRYDGVLPSVQIVAFHLRRPEADTARMLERLIAAGLIDRDRNGALRPHNWQRRQFRSDVSTERVRRFRQRQADAPSPDPSLREETEQNRTQKERFMKRCETVSGTAMQAIEGEGGSDLYDFFIEHFLGEVPDDLWQRFANYVHGHEAPLRSNLIPWMRTRKYQDGFGQGADKFLRSGVWKKVPKPEMLDPKFRSAQEIDYPEAPDVD